MNLQRFGELMTAQDKGLCQWISEWRAFLEFAQAYFAARSVLHPVVVEIGIASNSQKVFYLEFLGAEHIGIDINYQISVYGAPAQPDIVGDSHDPGTVEALKSRLAGRSIDLLFIDGDHAYDSVKLDYELYGPLTKHLIAIHDIHTDQWDEEVPAINVKRFWKGLTAIESKNTLLEIRSFGRQGIGVVIKDGGA